MSSLRNAIKNQKTHRERHQPDGRKQFGLLEKKKDYKIRAKDYNEKKKTLQSLRKRALDKNPDEFYFHMINSELRDGIHKEKVKEEVLTPEQIKLMQTQDLRYIIHKRTIEQKKIEKLKASLHLLDAEDKPTNTHTFFVDSEREKEKFDVAKKLDTHPALLDRTYNRLRLSDLAAKADAIADVGDDDNTEGMSEVKRAQYKAYKELKQRIERERQLAVVQAKMEAKRHLQNKKEKPVKLVKSETTTSAPVIKFASVRKR